MRTRVQIKETSSPTAEDVAAQALADLIGRSTPIPDKPRLVVTPSGERFNIKRKEFES